MDPNKDILARLEKLEQWKAAKERQQLSYPIDPTSVAVLQNYFMRINGAYTFIGNDLSGNSYTTLVGNQGNNVFEVVQSLLSPYTVDTSADTVTVSTGRFLADRLVYVVTETTPPGGLTTYDLYYTVNVTNNGTTFQLSLTSGGAAIDITSAGTGRQYIAYALT